MPVIRQADSGDIMDMKEQETLRVASIVQAIGIMVHLTAQALGKLEGTLTPESKAKLLDGLARDAATLQDCATALQTLSTYKLVNAEDVIAWAQTAVTADQNGHPVSTTEKALADAIVRALRVDVPHTMRKPH